MGRVRSLGSAIQAELGIPGRARRLAAGKRGLEIGGPSRVFRDVLPVYGSIGSLDNVNYAASTVWEGTIEAGETFLYDPRRPPGVQFIVEAARLEPIADASYEVVLSSHTLEHVANPLAALREWRRVLTDDGELVLVLPQKDNTFDHRRPVTSLQHLLEDEARGVGEDDLTHLPEILELHDLERDRPAGTHDEFAARSRENVANRCLHHHVFDAGLAAAVVRRVGFHVDVVDVLAPYHIVVLARLGR